MTTTIDDSITRLIEALMSFRHELRQFDHLRGSVSSATKHDLHESEKRIMSAISDFAAKQTAFNARVDAAISGVAGDVQALNDKITELQNSPGQITPEDQALLDGLQTAGESLASRLEALDALTPPVPPVA